MARSAIGLSFPSQIGAAEIGGAVKSSRRYVKHTPNCCRPRPKRKVANDRRAPAALLGNGDLPCDSPAMRSTPGVVRDRKTGIEEPGMIEIFVPISTNGRSKWTPRFRPLHLLTKGGERTTVMEWLKLYRPDLLPRSNLRR